MYSFTFYYGFRILNEFLFKPKTSICIRFVIWHAATKPQQGSYTYSITPIIQSVFCYNAELQRKATLGRVHALRYIHNLFGHNPDHVIGGWFSWWQLVCHRFTTGTPYSASIKSPKQTRKQTTLSLSLIFLFNFSFCIAVKQLSRVSGWVVWNEWC